MAENSITTPETSFIREKNKAANLRIVFMGTPEFAVASLDALITSGCNIAAVLTAPDKAAGRGMKLSQSAVKKYAVYKGLKILQPEKLKDNAFIEELRSLNADLQVVVAFRMLPEVVWNMPPMGTINLHGSLLPQYRGAAPINWALINGEKRTGVTTFKLRHDIDTGNVLMQEGFDIGEDETAGELHDRMKDIGAAILVKTVSGLAEGTLKEVSQDAIKLPFTGHLPEVKHAPKLSTATCKIGWDKPVSDVYNLVRGLSPFPGAFTYLNERMLKVYKAEKQSAVPGIPPGQFESDKKSFIRFACTDGFLLLKDIQLEGKKRMTVEEFLRGFRM